MKNLTMYFDLLNYLLSYRERSIEELIRILDRYFKDLSIPFVLCLQENKGFKRLKHPNLKKFKPIKGLDDDQQILRMAKHNNGYVVSNDRFRQYLDFSDYVGKRRIGHRIKDDNLLLYYPRSITIESLKLTNSFTKEGVLA